MRKGRGVRANDDARNNIPEDDGLLETMEDDRDQSSTIITAARS
jgi:hypothetical protein